MNPYTRVVEARHVAGYRVWLRFQDGLEGEVDLNDLAGAPRRGSVFEPLQDPAYFAQFSVDWTLTWPNGADVAPESLYARLLKARRAS